MNEKKEDVSLRHKEEWKTFRKNILPSVLQNRDLDEAKIAKAIADVLKTCQEGERKAWDFDRPDEAAQSGGAMTISWEE